MIHRGLERSPVGDVRPTVLVLLLILGGFFTLTASAGTTTYTYDAQGRLTGIAVQTSGQDQQTTTMHYDSAGNRTSLIYQYVDRTPPNPPTGVSATALAYNSIQVNWITSVDVGGGPVASYKVYRGGSLLAGASAPPYNDQTVAANTAYSYTVSAVDPSGNESTQAGPASATTPPGPDLVPPSVPTSLQGTAVSGTWINLTWGASTDTGGSGLAGYEIFRNNGGSPIGTSSVPSYADQSLAPYTTYLYTVRAYDGAGNRSSMSNQISVTTLDTVPPSAPGTPTFSGVGPTSATASWGAASDNAGVVNYRYSLNGGGWVIVGNVTSASLSGLALGTQYSLVVEAEDAAGNWGAQSGTGTFTTLSVYTDNIAYTGGQTGTTASMTYGYIAGGLGSMSPNTLSGGKAIQAFTSTINLSFDGVNWTVTENAGLVITGFATTPGSNWLQSISFNGSVILTGAGATMGCNGTQCSWNWANTTGPMNSSGTMTFVHQ
jgi:YD repeat-containing protein